MRSQYNYIKKSIMRYTLAILTILHLAGCVGSPPKPPAVHGEYRPINKYPTEATSRQTATANSVSYDVFDFDFEGDIVNSLEALRVKNPQLNILPVSGKITPLPIKINLPGTTLENVLRAIGEQGGGIADVIYTMSSQSGKQVFIQFRDPQKTLTDYHELPKELYEK